MRQNRYSGNPQFNNTSYNGSVSANEAHTVNKANTTTTITADAGLDFRRPRS